LSLVFPKIFEEKGLTERLVFLALAAAPPRFNLIFGPPVETVGGGALALDPAGTAAPSKIIPIAVVAPCEGLRSFLALPEEEMGFDEEEEGLGGRGGVAS